MKLQFELKSDIFIAVFFTWAEALSGHNNKTGRSAFKWNEHYA